MRYTIDVRLDVEGHDLVDVLTAIGKRLDFVEELSIESVEAVR